MDLGYEKGNAVSNFVNRFDEAAETGMYLQLFDQIWNDPEQTARCHCRLCDHIASVYQENSPERIYFLMLYNIFSEFLEDIDEDVLPNDRTGYQDSLVWKKLFNFQRDAATGIINKLETYNGCILADSVGLGKTFTALAVIKYYELRNRSVLVLCPKKLADNWLNYNRNLKTNIFAKDRFNYDVLAIPTSRARAANRSACPEPRQLGQLRPRRHRRVAQLPQPDYAEEKETRYQRLMNQVIREGVKTKVLMLSATPVNNRFTDLRNQLALAYEGESENLAQAETKTSRRFSDAQKAFNAWSDLPPAPNRRRHPESARLRLLRAARQRHHRPLAQAHPDLLRHQGYRHVPGAPTPLSFRRRLPPAGRARLQRDLRATSALTSRSTRRSPTCSQADAPSTRNSTTHGRQRRATSGKQAANRASGVDDGEPAQATRKLRPSLPAHAARLGNQSARPSDRVSTTRRTCRLSPQLVTTSMPMTTTSDPRGADARREDADRPRRHGPPVVEA